MSKFKFHVVLPDGSEYLTETLAEAQALEAKAGGRAHLPMRRRAEAANPARGRPDRAT